MCTVLEEQNSREDDPDSESSGPPVKRRDQIRVEVTPPETEKPVMLANGEDACFIVLDSSSRAQRELHIIDDEQEELRIETSTPTLSISSSSGYEGNSLSQATASESVLCSIPSSMSMPSSTTGSGDEEENEDPNLKSAAEEAYTKSDLPVKVEKLPEWMTVGESVRISPDSKLGVIAFIGETEFSAGIWVGVVLDSPTGKNDGTVNGVSYFTCKPKFGIFVKPDKLKCDPKGRALRQPAVKVNGKVK